MMGTLATVLAEKKIFTRKDRYKAEVEGDIEHVDGVLRITQIQVKYHLKLPIEQAEAARGAFSSYLHLCPAAQSVIGCIDIKDELLTGKNNGVIRRTSVIRRSQEHLETSQRGNQLITKDCRLRVIGAVLNYSASQYLFYIITHP